MLCGWASSVSHLAHLSHSESSHQLACNLPAPVARSKSTSLDCRRAQSRRTAAARTVRPCRAVQGHTRAYGNPTPPPKQREKRSMPAHLQGRQHIYVDVSVNPARRVPSRGDTSVGYRRVQVMEEGHRHPRSRSDSRTGVHFYFC